jgi:hypothetical protein
MFKRRASLSGVVGHVGPATLTVRGREIETFSRAVGRNRIALLATHPLKPGARVAFSVQLDGGTVTGRGKVERVHSEQQWSGKPETWLVIAVERLDGESTGRLVRMLYHKRYVEYVAAHPEARLRRPAPPPRPTEVPETPAPSPEPARTRTGRKRPSVGRYAAHEDHKRWRMR